MGAMNGRRCATYAHAAAPRLCLERYYEDACVIAVEPPPPPPPGRRRWPFKATVPFDQS